MGIWDPSDKIYKIPQVFICDKFGFPSIIIGISEVGDWAMEMDRW